MVERSMAFWMTVIFSDESRFSLFSDSGRVWVWRLNDQEFHVKTLQPTVKQDGHSAMVRVAIWSDGRSELVVCQANITSAMYVSMLQEDHLPTLLKTHKIVCSTMGTKTSVAKSVTRYEPYREPLGHIRMKNTTTNHKPSSKPDHFLLLYETRQDFSQDTTCELIKSMPKGNLALFKYKEGVN